MTQTYNHDNWSVPCTICGREGGHTHWKAAEEAPWLDYDPRPLPPPLARVVRAIIANGGRLNEARNEIINPSPKA